MDGSPCTHAREMVLITGLQAGFGLGCGLGTLHTLKCSGGEGAQASGLGSLATFSALVLTSIYVDRSFAATMCR